MRIAFDTEFIEDGHTIEPLSIGLVNVEDGSTYYAEFQEADHSRADAWVQDNVISSLLGDEYVKPREQIAIDIVDFVGEEPEFWAYFADYDWVLLCQLYGRMIDLPTGWPMFCMDLKQTLVEMGKTAVQQEDSRHNALADAQWVAAVLDDL